MIIQTQLRKSKHFFEKSQSFYFTPKRLLSQKNIREGIVFRSRTFDASIG